MTVPSTAQGVQQRDAEQQVVGKGTPGVVAGAVQGVDERRVESMQVAVRVRPLLPHEVDGRQLNIIRVLDNKMIIVLDPKLMGPKRRHSNGGLRQRSKEMKYAFDHALDETRTQGDTYEMTGKPLIGGVLGGCNATVFAYGATGSGKTFTMTGTSVAPGVMWQCLKDLFAKVAEDKDSKHRVVLTYLEIYNEQIRDLITGDPTHLDLREHPVRGVQVANLTDYEAENLSDIMELLQRGNSHRTTEPTEANAQSSRSHAVLQVSVFSSDKADGVVGKVSHGKLNLVDLAGSERGAATHNRGMRMVEGANINRSLLALGNCINALAEKAKGAFIPYRDSKLTRLLKDSLGGNCRTVMIANVSPSHVSLEETLNTLKYANRAKNIKAKVSRNVISVQYHISQYTRIINDLKAEIIDLRAQLTAAKSVQAQRLIKPADDDTSQTVEGLRKEILANYSDRRHLRKELLELQLLQLSNYEAIELAQGDIIERLLAKLSPAEGDDTETEADTVSIDETVTHLGKNERYRRELKERFAAVEQRAKLLREDVQNAVDDPAKQQMLMQDCHICDLELDKFDLEAAQTITAQISKSKDAQLRHLQLQLELRDQTIRRLQDGKEDQITERPPQVSKVSLVDETSSPSQLMTSCLIECQSPQLSP
eukprot:Sspe_Gene.39538::Locus_19075_Transcript_1_1_Confidence_1.000_Length_2056::g.39538::m.39538/K10401/KIF18_19; kinesin family member 18/19